MACFGDSYLLLLLLCSQSSSSLYSHRGVVCGAYIQIVMSLIQRGEGGWLKCCASINATHSNKQPTLFCLLNYQLPPPQPLFLFLIPLPPLIRFIYLIFIAHNPYLQEETFILLRKRSETVVEQVYAEYSFCNRWPEFESRLPAGSGFLQSVSQFTHTS